MPLLVSLKNFWCYWIDVVVVWSQDLQVISMDSRADFDGPKERPFVRLFNWWLQSRYTDAWAGDFSRWKHLYGFNWRIWTGLGENLRYTGTTLYYSLMEISSTGSHKFGWRHGVCPAWTCGLNCKCISTSKTSKGRMRITRPNIMRGPGWFRLRETIPRLWEDLDAFTICKGREESCNLVP